MTPRQLFGLRTFAAAGLLALAGCNVIPPAQPDLTRYYLLNGSAVSETPAPAPSGTLSVGLAAVELAPYLRKGSLVVRTGDNEVAFPSDARWAEPLGQEIAASLRRRLQAAPTVARVLVPPFPAEPARDFDVKVEVLRCEGVREGERTVARVVATLEISTAGESARVVTRKTIAVPDAAWDGKDFARLAALLGEAVGTLGQEIAAALPERKE